MLTFAYGGRGGGLRGHAYLIIVWKKMLNNLHKLFQGKCKSLEFFYLLYGVFNSAFGILLYNCMLKKTSTFECMNSAFEMGSILMFISMLMHNIFLYTTFVILKFNNLFGVLKQMLKKSLCYIYWSQNDNIPNFVA